MELPADLRVALERVTQGIAHKRLQELSEQISQRYREQHGRAQGPLVRSADEVRAYVATRMPATWAAVCAALKALQVQCEPWVPQVVLDVGAGPGTATWAASAVWPQLQQAILLEHEPSMLKLGKELAHYARARVVQQASWQQTNLATLTKAPAADLVVAAYVVGELTAEERVRVVEQLWQATQGACVIIEPGTPRGFELVREIRRHLIEQGATIVAPCPHADTCPMPQDSTQNWCHMAERIGRSKVHRVAKSAELGYEDEKYTYVAATRGLGQAAAARVLRHPEVATGRISLELCTPTGLKPIPITKRNPLWKTARKLRWGDGFEDVPE